MRSPWKSRGVSYRLGVAQSECLPVRDVVLVQEDQPLQSVSIASDTVQCGPLGYLKQLAYAFEHTFHCVYLGHIDTAQEWHDKVGNRWVDGVDENV